MTQDAKMPTAVEIAREVYVFEEATTSDLLRDRVSLFEQIEDLKATMEAIDKTLLARLSGRFDQARDLAKRPFGEIGTEIDGYEVRARFERFVSWDQQKLAEANTRWPMLINIKFTADERAMAKADSAARNALENARTVTYGSQILSVTETRRTT